MPNIAIITAKNGKDGDRVREKISEFGNQFIAVSEQNGTLLAFTLDGAQGIAFHNKEASWEIVAN